MSKNSKKFGYEIYYSPLASAHMDINLKFNPYALKIFFKPNLDVAEFEWTEQRENGRIIRVTIKEKDIDYSIIFLHNYSKNGNREVNIDQTNFIQVLYMLLKNGNHLSPSKKTLILGDFNLEPWDFVLRNKRSINAYFLSKHFNISKRNKHNDKNLFFNPITEKILNDTNPNLGGTYYSNNYGWALYDFPIYSKNNLNISFDILSEIGTKELVRNDTSNHKDMMTEEFDHLPILIKINDNE